MKHFFSHRRWWLCGVFAGACFVVLNFSFRHSEAVFHSEEELHMFRAGARSPIDSGEYFLGSITCKGCHGFDAAHLANVDENGNDINLYDDWEASMMAFSAVDPFWRAKVSHEILVNPAHVNELQSKCTQCHAPMGHFTAMFKGAAHYTLADVLADTLGLNGVACGACHAIGPDSIFGLHFSGNIHYDTNRVEYGPFKNPELGPMQLYVGLTPTYSAHVSRSQICAPCHTLLTKTADLNGNYTGNTFVEQATYHEWLNSIYNDSIPCQRCHMPQVNDPVIIANGLQNLSPRSPFNLHKFMGGNSTMLRLIKQNKSLLGIAVPDAHIDSSIAATLDLLQNNTLQMELSTDSVTADTLYVSVKLINKAGHKFPSGYPSRRAFLRVVVTNGSDTVFRSGMLQPDGELSGNNLPFEPHHNVIDNEQQVQIYEMVMGDVNGNFTTVLERAAVTLKDNRLPPVGFTTQHLVYDTVRIAGSATADSDFNKLGNTQGTGADVVHYHIPINGLNGQLRVSAAVYYQTLPPRWFTEMFSSYNSPFIDSFRTMYHTADKAPVLIVQRVIDSVQLIDFTDVPVAENGFGVFPVPSLDGNVIVQSKSGNPITSIELFDISGKLLQATSFPENKPAVVIALPETKGIYRLRIKSGEHAVWRKVLRQ